MKCNTVQSQASQENKPGFPVVSTQSTEDHIHPVNKAVEKSAGYTILSCMSSVGYKKAFDSVKIPAFVQAIRRQ